MDRSPGDEQSKRTILVRGDAVPVIAELVRLAPDAPIVDRAEPGSAIDAVVSGVALPPTDDRRRFAKTLRGRLRQETDQAIRHVVQLPRVRHLVFVLDASLGRPEPQELRLADGFAAHLHARLEAAAGAYVAVTVLISDGCPDERLLAHRVIERASGSMAAAAVAVSWPELRHRSIATIAAEELS